VRWDSVPYSPQNSLGASRIILVGHNEARLKLGQKFGATDLVSTLHFVRVYAYYEGELLLRTTSAVRTTAT
jgi:Zn-dependent alcohol dehydrogenase